MIPVSTFFPITEAPGMRAPLPSRTDPEIVAVVCAIANGMPKIPTNTINHAVLYIEPPGKTRVLSFGRNFSISIGWVEFYEQDPATSSSQRFPLRF